MLSHLSPGLLMLGLLQCTLHVATLEEYSETAGGAKCSYTEVLGTSKEECVNCCSLSAPVPMLLGPIQGVSFYAQSPS